MADWREWRKLALDTLYVAQSLDIGNERLYRSSANRFYYAAYQAMTALLLYAGHQPPLLNGEERECWSHEATPEMLVANLGGLGLTLAIRRDLGGDCDICTRSGFLRTIWGRIRWTKPD